jgi:hypothetical protein
VLGIRGAQGDVLREGSGSNFCRARNDRGLQAFHAKHKRDDDHDSQANAAERAIKPLAWAGRTPCSPSARLLAPSLTTCAQVNQTIRNRRKNAYGIIQNAHFGWLGLIEPGDQSLLDDYWIGRSANAIF